MHIEVREAAKTYYSGGKKWIDALSGIDLSIRDREFVCLLGPSGCGKSTLLRLIGGIEAASSGTVLCDGKPVVGPSPQRGFIFQDYALFPWLTVRQNIRFGLQMRKETKNKSRAIAEQYMQLFGLEEAASLYPKQLSGGMRQRVAIARALCLQPRLLLMDEPFAALDAMLRHNLQEEMVRVWQREKVTVVFVTHDVEEAIFLADRIVVMTPRPGTIRAVVPVELPRPRSRTDSRFVELRAGILRLLYEESRGDKHPMHLSESMNADAWANNQSDKMTIPI
ncbi:ABC transporter ATP-binding protein [Paenibacillus kobensis]|uniref:ABC transporter ATP-binding protein n=1 Tax=Paenibacillus kobensis TaxID=59841 RepID=UPI000FD84502|nr:ABC transporter ATP-binding protein [Paenibacillus kobensis]